MPYQYVSNAVTDILGAILGGLAIIFFAVFICLIPAILATWLWGLLVVPIFGLPTLTFWQMFGLMILVRIILPSPSSSNSSKSKN